MRNKFLPGYRAGAEKNHLPGFALSSSTWAKCWCESGQNDEDTVLHSQKHESCQKGESSEGVPTSWARCL